MNDCRLRIADCRLEDRQRPWFTWPMLLLAGYLLFAHGCHGDEDNELFMRLASAWTVQSQEPSAQP